MSFFLLPLSLIEAIIHNCLSYRLLQFFFLVLGSRRKNFWCVKLYADVQDCQMSAENFIWISGAKTHVFYMWQTMKSADVTTLWQRCVFFSRCMFVEWWRCRTLWIFNIQQSHDRPEARVYFFSAFFFLINILDSEWNGQMAQFKCAYL